MRDESEVLAFVQGKTEEKENSAKNMIKLGIDIKTISDITKLSIEKIEELKNN